MFYHIRMFDFYNEGAASNVTRFTQSLPQTKESSGQINNDDQGYTESSKINIIRYKK